MVLELCFQNNGEVGFRPVEIHEPGPEEVKIKTRMTALRHGEDYQLLKKAKESGSSLATPLVPQTWGIGEVVKIGEKVNRYSIGDRIHGPMPHRSFHIFHQERAYPLDWIREEFSVFIEGGAAALRCIHLSGMKYGDRVVILGVGAIGLMALQYALASGAGEVIAADPIETRLKVAQRLGAHRIINSSELKSINFNDLYAEVVVELSGSESGLKMGTEIVKPEGTVVAGGGYYSQALIDEIQQKALSRSIKTQLVMDHKPDQRLEKLVFKSIAAKTVIVWPIITHILPYKEAAVAYQQIVDDPATFIKILLYYD